MFQPTSPLRRRLEFGSRMRLVVYDKIRHLTHHGLDLTQALQELERQYRDRGPKRAVVAAIIGRWRRALLNGRHFDVAIAADVPPDDVMILAAAARSGNLTRALEQVAFLTEARRRISGVLWGLAPPAALFAAAIALLVFVSLYIVPAFAGVVPVDSWTGPAAWLAAGANFVVRDLPWLAILLLIAVVVIIATLPTFTGPVRTKLDRVGPWALYRLVQGASFMLAFAALVGEGVKQEDALETIGQRGNPWLRERIEATRTRMLSGEKFATALASTGFGFPDLDIIDDLRAFQDHDGFDARIESLARSSVDATIARVKIMAAALNQIGHVATFSVVMWYMYGLSGMQEVITSMANR